MTNKFVQYLIKLSSLNYPQPETHDCFCPNCDSDNYYVGNMKTECFDCGYVSAPSFVLRDK